MKSATGSNNRNKQIVSPLLILYQLLKLVSFPLTFNRFMLKKSLPWVFQLSYLTGNKSSRNANSSERRSFHFFAHFLPYNHRLRQTKLDFQLALFLRAFFVSLLLLFLFEARRKEIQQQAKQLKLQLNFYGWV